MSNPLDPFPPSITDAQAQEFFSAGVQEPVVLGFVREAVRYGRKCCRGSFDDGELISICYGALQAAAKNYRPDRGLGFFSFSKQYLRGAISREWRKRDVVKHSSTHEEDAVAVTSVNKELQVVPPDFDGVYTREEWELLWPAMQKRLNDVERMVVVLRYRADFSFEEIGRLRGVTRQAIQRSHREAILKLRRAMSHKQEKSL